MAFNNIRSKLDRAIAAYLVKAECGGVDDILPAKSSKEKKYPNTVVHSTLSKPEVQFTGLRRCHVQIHLRGRAVPNDNDQSRIQFDDRVAATADAMMISDNGGQSLDAVAIAITEAGRALAIDQSSGTDPKAAAIAAQNADMADFTCIEVIDAGEGDGEDTDSQGCSWHEVLLFDIVCSPSNTD